MNESKEYITHPDERVQTSYLTKYNLMSDKSISANSAMRLDDDIVEAMRKMEQMEEIVRRLPGYDCGNGGRRTRPPTGETYRRAAPGGVGPEGGGRRGADRRPGPG